MMMEMKQMKVCQRKIDWKPRLMFLGHDPFLSHLANRDESEFAHNVDDVKNNKWTLSTTTLEPGWSALCKVPASSKESSLSRTRMLQNAQIISVR